MWQLILLIAIVLMASPEIARAATIIVCNRSSYPVRYIVVTRTTVRMQGQTQEKWDIGLGEHDVELQQCTYHQNLAAACFRVKSDPLRPSILYGPVAGSASVDCEGRLLFLGLLRSNQTYVLYLHPNGKASSALGVGITPQ